MGMSVDEIHRQIRINFKTRNPREPVSSKKNGGFGYPNLSGLAKGMALPFNHRTGPGEAGSESNEQNTVASLDRSGAVGFIESDCHGRR